MAISSLFFVKRFLLPLLAVLSLPTSVHANVALEVHKLCLSATDYSGCVKLNSSTLGNQKINVDIDAIKNSGNFCPSNYAYVGGGYCQALACRDDALHDYRLRGKGWRGCAKNFFRKSMFFKGPTVRATTDDKCPLVEPELGRNNSCQNGVEEKIIYNSEPPIGMP